MSCSLVVVAVVVEMSGGPADLIAEIERTLIDGRDGRRHGDEITFRCVYPDRHANGDAKPGASWNTKKHAWCCRVCGAKGGYRDLARALSLYQEKRAAKRSPIVAAYDYTDEQGTLLFQVQRTADKEFPARCPDGNGGWIHNLNGVRRVPYHLPELLAAPADAHVFVPEGEKDVDALRALELVATCNPGGAGKWRSEYSDFLRGRSVVVLPDNDESGRRHAREIAQSVFPVASAVRILALPGFPPKGDVSDWLAAGCGKKQLLDLVERTAPMARGTLAAVVETFQRWLHMPDPCALYAVFGAIMANSALGDPVWLMLVGPPGSGKTELLGSLSRLPNVYPVGTLTEASLLSGTPQGKHAAGAKGGLLREIGSFGFIICKDFTSVLSLHRDARAGVLAALREIYDGAWTRLIGVDGGRCLTWEGKIALVAGCTPAIDSHHAVTSAMGERFVYFRMPETDALKQGQRALEHVGREKAMRAELADVVASLFAGIATTDLPELSLDRRRQVVHLASLAVRCRSAVERDAYRREIDLVPEPKAPARLALTLCRLHGGMLTIGVPEPKAWKVIVKLALDSMPAIRRKVFELLRKNESQLDTSTIAERTGYPTVTARRACEDLTAHEIVTRTAGGEGKADKWELSDWAREQYELATGGVAEMSVGSDAPTFSEKSDGEEALSSSPFNSSQCVKDDKTEKVPFEVFEP